MSLVLDGSAALAWCFEDEGTPAVDSMMERVAEQGAIVPALWRLEVANGLQVAVRRGRLDPAKRDALLSALTYFDITTDAETDRHAWTATVQLAEQYKLTLYDASYLELALRQRLPLASLDKELRRAAQANGVPLLGL